MSDSVLIKCVKCDADLNVSKNLKAKDMVTCPICVNSERFDKVMSQVSRDVADIFGNGPAKMPGNNPNRSLLRSKPSIRSGERQ